MDRGVHLSEAIQEAGSPSSRDRFRSEVAQMKANLSNFWTFIKFSTSSDGIHPKNEANHARTGENETTYFPFRIALIWLNINSMG